MARGQDLGARSRVDPGGKANRRPFGGTNVRPRTDVPVPRYRANFSRSESPFGIVRSRRGGRKAGRGRRFSR